MELKLVYLTVRRYVISFLYIIARLYATSSSYISHSLIFQIFHSTMICHPVLIYLILRRYATSSLYIIAHCMLPLPHILHSTTICYSIRIYFTVRRYTTLSRYASLYDDVPLSSYIFVWIYDMRLQHYLFHYTTICQAILPHLRFITLQYFVPSYKHFISIYFTEHYWSPVFLHHSVFYTLAYAVSNHYLKCYLLPFQCYIIHCPIRRICPSILTFSVIILRPHLIKSHFIHIPFQ